MVPGAAHPILMDRTLVTVVLAAAIASAIALVLLPGTEEQAAVYQAQERYDEAIAVYETRRARVPLTRYEAYSLAQLYARTGRTADLAALLKEEIARDPANDWARTQLLALGASRPQVRPAAPGLEPAAPSSAPDLRPLASAENEATARAASEPAQDGLLPVAFP